MNRLPVLTTADTVYQLFVTDASAAQIATLFIDPSPEAISRFSAGLTVDPALSLWIQCAAASTLLDSFHSMATWFATHGRRRFADAIQEQSTITLDEAAFRLRAVELTAQSVAAAERTAHVPDADRLGALLQNADQWLALVDLSQANHSSLDLLPDWLVRRMKEGAGCQPEDLTSGLSASAHACVEQSQAAWMSAGSIQLPLCELAVRMERLGELKHDFKGQLEREKLEALAELSAGAGHEINNPLAVISGRAQLLLEDEEHPERRRDLATIHAQARRVHEMILDMMLFARPPAPRKMLINLADVIEQVVTEAQPRSVESEVELIWNRSDRPLHVPGDAAQLAAALKALVDNALNATSAGGRVEIVAMLGPTEMCPISGRMEPTVRVSVIDSGTGIPVDVRRHLFDPYFSGRAAGRGLGLGLSKCWRIVTNHGGTIAVESEPGYGSRFAISLPSDATTSS